MTGGLVLVATVVMVVVMDPVDPRLDRCARRSSLRRSHSHQSRYGAPVVGLVGWWWWWWWWLLVLCVDGSDSKKRVPPKTVSWEHLFRPVATQHNSWEVLFTHRNELLHDPQEPSHPQRFMGVLFHHSKRATPTIRITRWGTARNAHRTVGEGDEHEAMPGARCKWDLLKIKRAAAAKGC